MKTTTTRWRGRTLVIPGVWFAEVPEVSIKQEDLRIYLAVLMPEFGDRDRALTYARSLVEAEYLRCRIYNLKRSIHGYARKYASLATDLLQEQRGNVFVPEGSWLLRGFEPALLQGFFLPGVVPGRRGKPEALRVLRAMITRERTAAL